MKAKIYILAVGLSSLDDYIFRSQFLLVTIFGHLRCRQENVFWPNISDIYLVSVLFSNNRVSPMADILHTAWLVLDNLLKTYAQYFLVVFSWAQMTSVFVLHGHIYLFIGKMIDALDMKHDSVAAFCGILSESHIFLDFQKSNHIICWKIENCDDFHDR